ncbi:MAG TPA: hypothetical protein PLM87_00460 [Bacteroidales bacterium]|nr:hypothetical protein [Bacteroidales bacterium]
MRNWIIYIISIIFACAIAYFQRITGPTNPVNDKVYYKGNEIKYELPRSADTNNNAEIVIEVGDTTANGLLIYKRFKSNDDWQIQTMKYENGKLIGSLPQLPAAGKMIYEVVLKDHDKQIILNNKGKHVILRYKDPVPAYVLIPHILLMFLSIFFAIGSIFFVIFNRDKQLHNFVYVAVISILLGGIILGAIVQKYAFGAFWTGWPVGNDLTDTKTLISLIFWIIAIWQMRKNKAHYKTWILVAAAIQILIYFIPHSLLGSELDFTEIE